MPLSASVVGRRSDPVVTEIDARWLMAYAAGLGESDACYFDTLRPDGIVGHPLFPVCVEWQTRQAHGPPGLTLEERLRGVHYEHDLELHRPLRPGMVVTTTSQVAEVVAHRGGALVVTHIEAEEGGTPLWTTRMTSLLRDVAIEGPSADRSVAAHGSAARASDGAAAVPEPPGDAGVAAADARGTGDAATVPVAATAAHVYTECARIWNPIHTDPAVAKAAGLPGIILHGTATLALGISRAIELANGRPEDVARVGGQFRAMVLMPSELVVRVTGRDDAGVRFDVWTAEGRAAVRAGFVTWRSARSGRG